MSSDRQIFSLKAWLLNASASAAGAVIASVFIALFLGASAVIPSFRDWAFGMVYMPGWLLLALIGLALTLGILAGWWIWKWRQRPDVFSVSAVPRHKSDYSPTSLEDRVIRMLRIADGRWVDIPTMEKWLNVSSYQDLVFALKTLQREQWIDGHGDNYLKTDSGHLFRLAENGVAYAKTRGYKTKREIQLNKQSDKGS